MGESYWHTPASALVPVGHLYPCHPIVQQGEGGHWELSPARTLTPQLWRTPRDTLSTRDTKGHTVWGWTRTSVHVQTAQWMNSGERTLTLLLSSPDSSLGLFCCLGRSRCPRQFYTVCSAFHATTSTLEFGAESVADNRTIVKPLSSGKLRGAAAFSRLDIFSSNFSSNHFFCFFS